MKNFKYILLPLALLFLIGCVHTPETETIKKSTNENQATNIPGDHTIEMTRNTFVPETISIKQGESIRFVNASDRTIWPAADIHPTHGQYPEQGGCLGSTFDACRGLNPGESYTFEFHQPGTWTYHDHLAPSIKGTIVVEVE